MRVIQNTKIITIDTGYGIGDDGIVYPGGCPDGVAGTNHPARSGPLFTEDGRAELGVTDVVEQARPDDRFFLVTDNGDGSFTSERRPHADLVAMIWEDVKRRRDNLTQSGGYPVAHGGETLWFHSDAYSLTQQLGLISAAMAVKAVGGDLDAPLIPVPWKTLSGARVTMTAALALKLLPASFAQQGAIFGTADAMQLALDAAEEPESVDWRVGWPAVFEAAP